MLTTLLIGTVQVGFGGRDKTVATFTWDVQQWPLDLTGTLEDTRQHFTRKGDWMIKNVYTYGEGPPLEQVIFISTPVGNLVTNLVWGDYPLGGIRLTINYGTTEYILTGDYSKTELVFIADNKTDPAKKGILEVSKWSFIITGYEGTEPPFDWDGSTMSGTLRGHDGEEKIIGNKGTGFFEGAVLRGTQIIHAGAVFQSWPPPDPPLYVLFSWAEGSGEIVFP